MPKRMYNIKSLDGWGRDTARERYADGGRVFSDYGQDTIGPPISSDTGTMMARARQMGEAGRPVIKQIRAHMGLKD